MLKRTLMLACAAAALAVPGAAAADTTVAPDPAAGSVTALDGTVVWVSGKFGSETLMQKTAAGVARVAGAPTAKNYPSIDLGHDARGTLVLTYLRCATATKCSALRDDLHGHRASIRNLAPSHCALSTAPALWRTRVAYGLECKGRASGLYVKKGSATAKRLARPRDAVRFGSRAITRVDLRGTWVGAVAADVYEYAFSERVNGVDQEYFLAAASEGDSDEHVVALAVGRGGDLWTLVDSLHVGDPNQAIISRLVPKNCLESEALGNAPGPNEQDGYRATSLAVDERTLFLTAPGTGIVSHGFAPAHPCMPPA